MPGLSSPAIAPPADGDRRYRAVVAYDGAPFHGFAANEGMTTVAGELIGALTRITGRPIDMACAGRTDAGVHGWGQVVSFDAAHDLDPARIQHSLNRMLGPSVAIRELKVAADDFDARFSARTRTYRYRVLNREVPDPFLHPTTWHVPQALDLRAMSTAGHDLVGEHDFASFCRKKTVVVDGQETQADLTRRVLTVEWRRVDDIVEQWITANAFCHQMVRAITGTLVEIGLGKRPMDAIAGIIAARDRQVAGVLAPPQGLTLWDVGY